LEAFVESVSSSQPIGNGQGRLVQLDGLRGLAAFNVIVYHFLCAFVPVAIPNQTAALAAITNTPVALLYNGDFAVIIFFVLSGFVISNAVSKSANPLIVNLLARFVRLAIPASASVLLAWSLLVMNPHSLQQLSIVLPHPWLGRVHAGASPSVLESIRTEVFQVFKYGGPALNPVLWTMQYELVGSCFLYVFYSTVSARIRLPLLAAGVILSQFPHWFDRLPLYCGFFLGALLFECWSKNWFPIKSGLLTFVLGGLLGSFSIGFHDRVKLPEVWQQFKLGNSEGVFYVIGAGLMIYGCMQSRVLERFFSLWPMRFLGRISFSLYLVHLPLLLTAFSAIYLHWRPQGTISLFAMFLLYAIASLLLAIVMTVAVDEPLLRRIASFKRAARLKSYRHRLGKFVTYLTGRSALPERELPGLPPESLQ
jgi:peptidoglycan/LPS O-acetylase OafA/YrhL